MSSLVDEKAVQYSQTEVLDLELSDSSESTYDPDAGKTAEERVCLDKQLVRKIDFWLIPWLCLLYLLSFLDRVSLS